MDVLKPLLKTDGVQIDLGRNVSGLNRPLLMVCPECGKKMLRRTAKKGPGAGSQFWGCSGFPTCKVIRPIE